MAQLKRLQAELKIAKVTTNTEYLERVNPRGLRWFTYIKAAGEDTSFRYFTVSLHSKYHVCYEKSTRKWYIDGACYGGSREFYKYFRELCNGELDEWNWLCFQNTAETQRRV